VITAFTVSESFVPDPTPVSTPFPAPYTPFEEATVTPSALGDLQPFFGNGTPVRVRNPSGGPFVKNSDVLVDFFVTNGGTATISGDYFIDLYIDDVIAQRWSGITIAPDHFTSIEGGTGLLDSFQLQPGEHEIKLVIDPTNLIPEKSDADNTYTTSFTWEGPAIPAAQPGDRLPNLSLVGGVTGIIAAPYSGASSSGGLSTKGGTHFSFAVLNDSPVTITRDFNINMLFDDVVVYKAGYLGLVGGQYIKLNWQDLASVIHISPGEHTVKLVADPGGAIAESDESDNSVEVTLTWGTDEPIAAPAPAPLPSPPARPDQTLPNLGGMTPHGWNAAITASSADSESRLGVDGELWSSVDTNISFAIRNNSRVASTDSDEFEAHIFVDGVFLDSVLFLTGDDAGSLWTQSLTIPADTLEPGQHLVKLVIDANEDIAESDETDNVLARWFEFQPDPVNTDPPEAFVLSDEQLAALLAPLTTRVFVDQVRSTDGSGVVTPDWADEIQNIGKAGYYLLTGGDLDAEPIVTHLLPHDQFMIASISACMRDHFLLSDEGYAGSFQTCSIGRGEVGFKYRRDGKLHVYVDLKESPIKALGVYLHELGHALQDLENPDQTNAAHTANLRGLFEAQAQIFEAAVLRTIESYMGINLMRLPDADVMRNEVQFILDNSSSLIGSSEHVLGHNLLWHAVLADTSGLNLDDELRANKRLSGSSAKALYDYLVSIDPADVTAWATIILSDASRANEFVAISLSRLETDLPINNWGNPGLREPALLAP